MTEQKHEEVFQSSGCILCDIGFDLDEHGMHEIPAHRGNPKSKSPCMRKVPFTQDIVDRMDKALGKDRK